jgi:hypothetical protein
VSVTAPSRQPVPARGPGAILCPRCGTILRAEQGWCLECGLAARTRIHPPPSWRIPIATTLLVLVLLAAGISLALVALLDTTPPRTPAATVTAPATTGATTPQTLTTPTTATPSVGTIPQTPTSPSTTAPATTPTIPSAPGAPPIQIPGSALPQTTP